MKKSNLRRLSKLFFLVFLPLLFILFSQSDMVKAGDVSNNISSLTVSSEEITDGGQTTVKFTFDEHAQKIQPGDTLRVNWTSSGTIYGTGFKKTIPLSIDGTYVGDMVITDGAATVTFNEGIKNIQNIHGWGEFEIEGHNDTATDKEHVGKFTIISGVRTVDLNVKKMATGVNSAPFYLKAGDMHANDPEHILWTLTINAMNLEADGNVRVEDEIQGGHSLVKDSFSITTTGNKPGYYSGSTAIDDFLAAFPGATFTIEASGKITVTLPQSEINKTGVLIFYQTKVENDKQKNFLNNTKVWYQVKGEQAVVAKEVNASVANINANGGVDGDMTSTTTKEPKTTVTSTEEPKTTVTSTEEPKTTVTSTEEPKTTVTSTEEPKTTVTSTEEPKTTVTSTEKPKTTVTSTEEPKTTVTSTEEPKTTVTSTEEPKTTVTSSEEPKTTVTSTEEPKTTVTSTEEPKTTVTSTKEPKTTVTSTKEPKTTVTSSEEPKTTVTSTEEPKTTVTSTEEPKTTVTSTEEPKTTITSTEDPKSTPTKSTTKPNLSGTTATSKRPASNGDIKGDRKVILPNTGEMVATGLVLTGALVLAGSVVMKRKLTKN